MCFSLFYFGVSVWGAFCYHCLDNLSAKVGRCVGAHFAIFAKNVRMLDLRE